jgi:DNA-binding LacI/PurR family transcriptional regulator
MLTIEKRSRVEQVYDRLRELTTGAGLAVGDRLQPVRTLAQRFGTSVPTVQRAIAQLVEEGVLESRPGSGVYVASPHAPLGLEHAVALCMEVGADVFGELATRLLNGVQGQGCFATLVDTSSSKGDELLQRMSHTGASCLVIHGNGHFPFHVLQDPTFRRIPLVGVIDWDTDLELPGVHRVLSDFAAAGRTVTEHLWELGHRRVLVTGTQTQIAAILDPEPWHSPAGSGFTAAWTARGGQWQTLASTSEGRTEQIGPEQLLPLLTGPAAPTAIVGLRDREAHLAQRVLRRHRPALAERIAIVGYYDTPWAVASDPPLTAVNLDLPELARATLAVLDPLLAGRRPQPTRVFVPPRLIVRETSFPAAH